MPDIYAYSSDPGLEALLDKGAVVNLVEEAQVSPPRIPGEAVLGVVGTLTNDRGRPNEPVELTGGVQDIFGAWGGFSPHVGDGREAGYNGNMAALLDGLRAPRIVMVPVDMALKEDGEDLPLTVARGGFTAAGDDASDFFDGGFIPVNGDRVVVVSMPETTEDPAPGDILYVRDSDGEKFKLSLTADGSAITVTSPGPAVLYLLESASPPALGPRFLPAGSRFRSASGFIVRTLEDLAWGEGELGGRSVRVAKVSGSETSIGAVNEFIGDAADRLTNGQEGPTELVTVPLNTDTPDAMNPSAILARYSEAIDALSATPTGLAANVLITDRTEASIADYLSVFCGDSLSEGVFRVAVVAPPVGTSLSAARDTDADGAGRPTLAAERVVYTHPGWQRSFARDPDAPRLVTFPGHAVFAAAIAATRFEANPARPSEAFVAYRCAALELPLNRQDRVLHFRANIAQPTFERLNGRDTGSIRDGVMADGSKIADRRLKDFLASGLIATSTPYHKQVATPANREALIEACINWLERQRRPPAGAAPRIAAYAVTLEWDAQQEHAQVICAAQKLGNMDVLTIRLRVSADDIEA